MLIILKAQLQICWKSYCTYTLIVKIQNYSEKFSLISLHKKSVNDETYLVLTVQ